MVFSTFYKELATFLLGIKDTEGNSEILHVDLWRDIPKTTIATPAVFIQFMQTPWKSTGGGKQEGETEIRLHIIRGLEHPTKANHNKHLNKSLAHLETVDTIHKNLTRWRSSVSTSLERIGSDTDKAPSRLFHNIEMYRTKLIDISAMKKYIKKHPNNINIVND